MRYTDRIELIYTGTNSDSLHGVASTTTQTVTCLVRPVTDLHILETFGLVNTRTFEVHIKNTIPVPNRVKYMEREWTINRTFVNRKTTVLLITGGA